MKLLITILFLIAVLPIGTKANDNFSINGYYKNFFVVYYFSESLESFRFSDNATGIVTNRIRLDSRLDISSEVKLNISYNFAPRIQDNNFSQLSLGDFDISRRNYRFDDLEPRLYPSNNRQPSSFVIYQNLDRLNLSIRTGSADIYIGRQAIAWGSARTINPTDVIAPYSFDQLDSEERIGVDAIRLRIPIGFMGEFDAGYLFGEDFEAKNSAFYLRGKFYTAKTDFSLLALGFRENLLIGFDMTRAIGGAGFWFESAYVLPNALNKNISSNENNYFRSTIGFDYSLTDKTYGFIEYHYNQPGSNNIKDYLTISSETAYFDGSVYFKAQHYLIPGVTYQISPLIIFSGQTIWNLNDNSLLLAFSSEYNIAENIYLSAGAYIGVGKATILPSYEQPLTIEYGTEFGGYADIYFTSFRVYF